MNVYLVRHCEKLRKEYQEFKTSLAKQWLSERLGDGQNYFVKERPMTFLFFNVHPIIMYYSKDNLVITLKYLLTYLHNYACIFIWLHSGIFAIKTIQQEFN